jgi:hypothetical protein
MPMNTNSLLARTRRRWRFRDREIADPEVDLSGNIDRYRERAYKLV